jgi:uncharacterized protein (DUF1697 family)
VSAKRTYIALLRALNVGGRFVRMERLRELFASLGFERVRSYIQSGNVFFDSTESNRRALAGRIEAHLEASLGFACPVFLRTIPEIERALARDAFNGFEGTKAARPAILFVDRPLPENVALPLRSPKGDTEVLDATRGELFVIVRPFPDGRPGNPVAYVEKTFGLAATARFDSMLAKMLQAAKASAVRER